MPQLTGRVSSVGLIRVGRQNLCVLDGCGSCAVAFTDLFCREPASANAATPARRRGLRDSGHRLLIGAPGSHQFATALRTLSLNHKLSYSERISCRSLRELDCQGGSCESPQP